MGGEGVGPTSGRGFSPSGELGPGRYVEKSSICPSLGCILFALSSVPTWAGRGSLSPSPLPPHFFSKPSEGKCPRWWPFTLHLRTLWCISYKRTWSRADRGAAPPREERHRFRDALTRSWVHILTSSVDSAMFFAALAVPPSPQPPPRTRSCLGPDIALGAHVPLPLFTFYYSSSEKQFTSV